MACIFSVFIHLAHPHVVVVITGYLLSLFLLWHSRLGHMSVTCLRQLISSGCLGNVPFEDLSDCLSHRVSKSIVLPFHRSTTHTTHAFNLVHSLLYPGPENPMIRVVPKV